MQLGLAVRPCSRWLHGFSWSASVCERTASIDITG
ncbi:hypothetical protein A4R44_04076 [Amycolatopsis sp. M39]|nr:hypothetical protein A4R44_04076 [Amycolatopsis sp. M39]